MGSLSALFFFASLAAINRFSKLLICSYIVSLLARRLLSGPACVSASCQRPWHPFFLLWEQRLSVATSGALKGSETTPDVAVAIRPRVVEVQRSRAGVAAVVPVAATIRKSSNAKAFDCHYATDLSQPPVILPISTFFRCHISYFFKSIYLRSKETLTIFLSVDISTSRS